MLCSSGIPSESLVKTGLYVDESSRRFNEKTRFPSPHSAQPFLPALEAVFGGHTPEGFLEPLADSKGFRVEQVVAGLSWTSHDADARLAVFVQRIANLSVLLRGDSAWF